MGKHRVKPEISDMYSRSFQSKGESDVNHVLSYCRYVQSLPVSSERLPATLDTLKPLVQGLWSGMRPNEASGSLGRMGKHCSPTTGVGTVMMLR